MPSAPPAVYSVPNAHSENQPDVSFNLPTYQKAATDNIYWDPRTNTDNKY